MPARLAARLNWPATSRSSSRLSNCAKPERTTITVIDQHHSNHVSSSLSASWFYDASAVPLRWQSIRRSYAMNVTKSQYHYLCCLFVGFLPCPPRSLTYVSSRGRTTLPPRCSMNDFVYKHCRFFSKNALFLARIFNYFIKRIAPENTAPITTGEADTMALSSRTLIAALALAAFQAQAVNVTVAYQTSAEPAKVAQADNTSLKPAGRPSTGASLTAVRASCGRWLPATSRSATSVPARWRSPPPSRCRSKSFYWPQSLVT